MVRINQHSTSNLRSVGCSGRKVSMDLVLSAPEPKDNRFSIFKERVQAFYRWRWNQDCPWNGGEASQLFDLLSSCPTLDVNTFSRWLVNYGNSDDIKPGERPRSFLPRIHNYSQV